MNREILKAKIAEAISSQNTSGNEKLDMILAAVDSYSSADNGAKPEPPQLLQQTSCTTQVCPFCNCEAVGFGGFCGDNSLRCMEC